MNEIRLEKMTFVIGERRIDLTEDEARGLRDALNGFFGAPYIIPTNPWPYPQPWYELGPTAIGPNTSTTDQDMLSGKHNYQ